MHGAGGRRPPFAKGWAAGWVAPAPRTLWGGPFVWSVLGWGSRPLAFWRWLRHGLREAGGVGDCGWLVSIYAPSGASSPPLLRVSRRPMWPSGAWPHFAAW